MVVLSVWVTLAWGFARVPGWYDDDPVALVRRLREEEKLGPAAIARRLKIGRASVYRLLGGSGAAGAPSRQ